MRRRVDSSDSGSVYAASFDSLECGCPRLSGNRIGVLVDSIAPVTGRGKPPAARLSSEQAPTTSRSLRSRERPGLAALPASLRWPRVSCGTSERFALASLASSGPGRATGPFQSHPIVVGWVVENRLAGVCAGAGLPVGRRRRLTGVSRTVRPARRCRPPLAHGSLRSPFAARSRFRSTSLRSRPTIPGVRRASSPFRAKMNVPSRQRFSRFGPGLPEASGTLRPATDVVASRAKRRMRWPLAPGGSARVTG